MPNSLICPLCSNNTNHVYYNGNEGLFYRCKDCDLIHKSSDQLPSTTVEKERYLTHNNDVTDIRYQNFVSPIVEAVKRDFLPKTRGLDFGAGTGPVITKMLSEKGYALTLYDTFFHSNNKPLQQSYDFIVCCEVMEHFHHPHEDFLLLKKLLKPKGKLYCMTEIYSEAIDFKTWYYKNDETHVVFYSKKTINWIQQTFNFSEAKIDGRLITFSV